jgi:hypothetical protein
MIDRDPEDPVQVEITRLTKDPLDRDPAGFWIPAVAPRPPGYLQDAR